MTESRSESKSVASNDPVGVAVAMGVGAVWTALPDYIESRGARRLVRAGLVVAGMTAVAARHAVVLPREGVDTHVSDASEPVAGPDPSEGGPGADGDPETGGSGLDGLWNRVPATYRPVAMAVAGAAGVGFMVGGLVVSQKIDDAVAGWFARRGVEHPYTATGMLWGALVPVVSLLDSDRP